MNSAQRRKKLRPLEKEWVGKRVVALPDYFFGATGVVESIRLTAFHPVEVRLDAMIPVRGRLVSHIFVGFDQVERLPSLVAQFADFVPAHDEPSYGLGYMQGRGAA